MPAPKPPAQTSNIILGHFVVPQDALYELTLTKIIEDDVPVRYDLEIRDFGDYTLVPYKSFEEATEGFMNRVNAQIAFMANDR